MKEPLLYKITRPIITMFVKIVFHPKIIGQENLNINEGYILAGNHTSYFDPLLIIACNKRCIHFLAKDSLAKGIKKGLFLNMGIIPVDRSKKNPVVVSNAIAGVKNGNIIGIFPEGTINRERKNPILPFKMGAFKIAQESDRYIVPFTIKGKYRLFNGKLCIVFGKPRKITKDLEIEKQALEREITKELERSY